MNTARPAQAAAPRRSHWQGEWRWLGLLLAGLAAVASWQHWTWRLDQTLYGAGLSTWTRPAPQDVLIVAIDDASLQALGRWPWRRGLYAQALDRLSQAQARSVLINLLMSEPDADPAQDLLLAQAIQGNERVVLPVGLSQTALGTSQELRPLPAFMAHAQLAHADMAPDVDGVLRSTWLQAGPPRAAYPHPALALMQVGAAQGGTRPQALVQSPSAHLGGWERDGRVAIRFLGPPGHIQHVSFAALLRGEVPSAELKGRDVLIGVTASGLADTFLTPVSGLSSGMSGVEVNAQFLAALRHDQTLFTVPAQAQALVHAALILALVWSFRRATPRQALMHALRLATGWVLLCWWLLSLNVWMPPFSTALAALLAYPVWSWRRLESTARSLEEQWQALTLAEHGVHHQGVQGPLVPRPLPVQDAQQDFMSQRTEALRLATTQLQEARQLLSDTLAALPDALYVTDAQGIVTQANRQAARISAVQQPQQVLGQTISAALHELQPAEAPTWALLLDRARHEGGLMATEASDAQGRPYLVNLAAMLPTDVSVSSPGGVIVCITDVSALRHAELQRQELMGFIAHDIRSPQASLLALVEMQQTGDGLPQHEVLEHVDSLARGTLDLCEELLQVMRAETRALQRRPTDLYSLAEECMDAVQPQAQRKHIGLSGDWDGESRHMALVDDYLLHRAVVNLLNNAIKFSPSGSEVRLSVQRRDGQHVLAVHDQGPGIAESELGRLFRRYERVEQGRPSQLAAGIGLGLVFIDTVVRHHGGQVRVSSTPGTGSCFELCLPIQEHAD